MKTYSMSEASKMTGVPVETIRFYERKKLLIGIKRNENGYREFEYADLGTLIFILTCKEAGFLLKEIKSMLDEQMHLSIIQLFKGHDVVRPLDKKVMKEIIKQKVLELEKEKAMINEKQTKLTDFLDRFDVVESETPKSCKLGQLVENLKDK